MFDFAWSEIALIAVVALIAIGPKDMPVAIKTVTDMIKKARRMAGEFQTHVDEMVREADLHEVRDSIREIRTMDIKGTVERTIDPDGSLRTTFTGNPLTSAPIVTPPPSASTVADTAVDTLERPATTTGISEVAVAEHPITGIAAPPPEPEPAPNAAQAASAAPAFVPPEYARPAEPPPAFIPPGTKRDRRPA